MKKKTDRARFSFSAGMITRCRNILQVFSLQSKDFTQILSFVEEDVAKIHISKMAKSAKKWLEYFEPASEQRL